MKNPQRIAQRKTANVRQSVYAAEMTATDDNGNRLVQHPPKFVKWLRGKFGMTAAERMGAKPVESKAGAPYQRVQHRVAAANGRR